MIKEDWTVLQSFFPKDWEKQAMTTKALKGLRNDKSAENYIRILLIHIASGHSLRETATRAKLAGLGNLSDVALLKRLRKAKNWLHSLCVSLFKEQEIELDHQNDNNFSVRLFDATHVKEPGKTGSQWRIHYSLQVPSVTCDYFKLTPAKGSGTGESFFQYTIKKGDYIIGDRGYSTAAGIHHVASKKAFVMVRVNTKALPIYTLNGTKFNLLNKVTSITEVGEIGSWKVSILNKQKESITGRICVIRKSNEAIESAKKKILRQASKKQHKVMPETLKYAEYIIVFTTYPEKIFSAADILNWYRVRWQVELVFKRFKSIAQLGHLPKHNDDSAIAWLYGKLFVSLLTLKLIKYATSISPWGYIMEIYADSKCMA